MEGDGFKTTKSPQNTRGENIGAKVVDAGPILAEQMLRNGDEVFESELTGKSYVLNEKQRRRIAIKANKEGELQARLKSTQNIKLEADGSLKPTNIAKPGQQQQQTSKEKPVNAMLESQQTVIVAKARSHGLTANTHQGAVKALKEEKKEVKQEKQQEKKEKRKHTKAEEKKRERAKESDSPIKF